MDTNRASPRSQRKRNFTVMLCISLTVMMYSVRTINRNVDWRDEESLYRSAINVNPAKGRFYIHFLSFPSILELCHEINFTADLTRMRTAEIKKLKTVYNAPTIVCEFVRFFPAIISLNIEMTGGYFSPQCTFVISEYAIHRPRFFNHQFVFTLSMRFNWNIWFYFS